MLLHEDTEMEETALDGGFCLCVPVSVWLAAESDEPEITAYRNVWDICEKYEKLHGGDPFSADAIAFLEENIAPVIKKHGYCCDVKDHRVVNEYRMSSVTDAVRSLAEGTVIVRSADEVKDLPCLCLHKPEPDEDDECDVCAVVISDGAVVAVAGVNDMFTDDTIEIHVETSREYRRRGFGTSAVAALSEYLTGLGYTVGYKCGVDNTASVGIAERLGMTLSGRRFDMVCYADE